MLYPLRLLAVMSCLLLSQTPRAAGVVETDALQRHFDAAGLKGTFVLYDASADQMTVYNPKRAATAYTPASTFKIFNSLAAFDSGAVRDADEILPYGGKPQWLPAWERDMHLRDAMRLSNVPIYQEVARRIGQPRLQAYVKAVGYGNADIGPVVDRFWLDGPLAITAEQQARFTARLGLGQLPFSAKAMSMTRDIMQLEKTADYTLYGKTGWATNSKPAIGWWVGYLQRGDKVYGYALNIDMPTLEDAPKRMPLGKACLKALGVLP
ncbi:class D beta-lactamase [Chitinimonas sp. JJ19]|uniref:class D beta-lactamase n=1 Tax=Chitinimonas sp. JJ19 TaxID=3109352 RepID=UPI003000FFF6